MERWKSFFSLFYIYIYAKLRHIAREYTKKIVDYVLILLMGNMFTTKRNKKHNDMKSRNTLEQ